MRKGVIYYNRGYKCLARLAVSLHSLRKHYSGEVRVVTDNLTGCELIQEICDLNNAELFKTEFPTPEGRKTALLNKTLLHLKSDFDVSVFIDADTLIVKQFEELFAWAAEYDFVITQFHDWQTKGKIKKRILSWKNLYPNMMKKALEYGHAINCGVFAWNNKSMLMQKWWGLATPGRDTQHIPDETCLQIMLPNFKHYLAPCEFNASCKFGDPYRKEARILHYHGNKHCRMEGNKFRYTSDLWYKEYFEIADLSVIKAVYNHDRMLRKYQDTARKVLEK